MGKATKAKADTRDALDAGEWVAGAFKISTSPRGPLKVDGFVARGLGLWLRLPGSPKGRRKPEWSLTHLGSGHRVAKLHGDFAAVAPIASEIADLGDWTFDGLQGWRNRDPELLEKTYEVIDRHGKAAEMTRSGEQSHEQARVIAGERWAA